MPNRHGISQQPTKKAQQAATAAAMVDFMERMDMAIAGAESFAGKDAHGDDLPQTPREAAADEEDARMQLLLDRVVARIEREGLAEIKRFLQEARAVYQDDGDE